MTHRIDTQLIIISIFLGLILTVFFLDYSNIGFTDTEWLKSYDLKSDYLALKFFLNDKWRFPLGYNPNYGEIPNSIVFSGAVPILSFISKIFRNILPENFHFFSIWIFLCFSLQYFFSFKILNFLTKDYFFSLVSAFFFLISPILIFRLNLHLSLGAHWLILAAFYLDIYQSQKNIFYKKLFIIILSSLIHFYFTIILLIMNLFFSFFNYFENKNLKKFFKENLIILIVLCFFMYVCGYFELPATDALGYGYGYFKSNLLTFVDPNFSSSEKSWSIFISDIYNSPGEKEGFGYLGLGILLIILIVFFLNIKDFKKIKRINYKYFFLSIFLLTLSFTNNINLGSYSIIDFELPKFIFGLLSIIRASGRLIWPVYYLILIFSIYGLYKSIPNKKIYILIILLSIQIIDFSGGLKNNFFSERILDDRKFLKNRFWSNMSENFENISNTQISNRSSSFPKISSLLIEKKFKKTNFFRLGRYNREIASNYRSDFYKEILNEKINTNTAYVIENYDHLRNMKFLFENSEHGFFYKNNIWFFLPNYKKFMQEKDILEFEVIKYKNINLGDKIKINLNESNGILGFGWSHPSYGSKISNSGAWTEGNFSNLIFNISAKNIDKIIINTEKILKDESKNIKLNFSLNNITLTNQNIKIHSNEIHLLSIKNYLELGSNKLVIEIENPQTALSKLESIDARLLGVLINSLEFK